MRTVPDVLLDVAFVLFDVRRHRPELNECAWCDKKTIHVSDTQNTKARHVATQCVTVPAKPTRVGARKQCRGYSRTWVGTGTAVLGSKARTIACAVACAHHAMLWSAERTRGQASRGLGRELLTVGRWSSSNVGLYCKILVPGLTRRRVEFGSPCNGTEAMHTGGRSGGAPRRQGRRTSQALRMRRSLKSAPHSYAAWGLACAQGHTRGTTVGAALLIAI